jgi:hypothetical protein
LQGREVGPDRTAIFGRQAPQPFPDWLSAGSSAVENNRYSVSRIPSLCSTVSYLIHGKKEVVRKLNAW